jgi:hypothetical protein
MAEGSTNDSGHRIGVRAAAWQPQIHDSPPPRSMPTSRRPSAGSPTSAEAVASALPELQARQRVGIVNAGSSKAR